MAVLQKLNGQWVDYADVGAGILVRKNGQWVEGTNDPDTTPIAVMRAIGTDRWIQIYPKAEVTYLETYYANDLKYIHSQGTNSTWTTDTVASRPDTGANGSVNTKCGVYTSGAVYTGWIGMTPDRATVQVGKGNIKEVKNVEITYERRGVGYQGNEYPLPLVMSNLKSRPSGITGAVIHNTYKIGNTMLSDQNMVAVPEPTNTGIKGVVTMNSDYARSMFKNYMNTSDYSIMLGYRESTNTPFVGFYGMTFRITYTATITRALFKNIPSTYNIDRNSDGFVELWLYDDELELSFEEIMARREKENRTMVKTSDVQLISL